jgi:hypothetical protein
LDSAESSHENGIAESDGTTSTGWLYKSNFADDDNHAAFLIMIQLGNILMDTNVCLYSKWYVEY